MSLPENKTVALKRLYGTERKMDKELSFAKEYTEKLIDYEEKECISQLSEKEANKLGSRIWYLPHFAVFNPNKPGKLRLVIDAAAKLHGMGRNDALIPGPDLLRPLAAVLFCFRKEKIAYTSDIKEMFHQVRIRQEDRSAQRLLWRNNDKSSHVKVYEMQAMTFGAVCSPCQAQFVKNFNTEELKESKICSYEVCEAITKRHYMDDYLDRKANVEKAIALIDGVIEAHKAGGFIIHNVPEILSHLPSSLMMIHDDRLDHHVCKNTTPEGTTERVLGVHWDPKTNMFVFLPTTKKLKEKLVETQRPTKRTCLRLIMSIFDPLGFLSCLQTAAKTILQDTWKAGIGWDDEIPDALKEK